MVTIRTTYTFLTERVIFMDNRKLHALMTTLRTGSFNKAAAELHCTQSAVTQMMNALENELGCKILYRSHSGVRLTTAGETLYPLLSDAHHALEQLASQAQILSQQGAQVIRIGSFSSISNTWLPKVLRAYQESFPGTSFDIRVGTDTLPQWLQDNQIDLALGDAHRCNAFQWYPLMDDPYYAVMPPGLLPEDTKSITQEEFARYTLIMAPMNALEAHLSVLSNQRINVSSDDDSSILSIVAQGLGVTAMPKLSLRRSMDDLRVLDLLPVPKRVLGVALPKAPSQAAKSFAAFLCQHYSYQT